MDKVLTPQDFFWLPDAEEWRDRIQNKLDRDWIGEWLRKPLILMSGSASNYLSKKIIEEVFGGVAFGAPANEYLALATTLPDDTTTGTTIAEANYGSYARTQVGTGNNQTDAWNAATGTTTATVTNKNAITCPTSTSGSNTIVGGMIADASTVGNSIVWFSTASTAIASGDTPKVNAAAMSHVLD